MKLSRSLEEIIAETQNLEIEPLSIQSAHTLSFLKLPLHHRDPFDRIIIAQAIAENLSVVSADEQFDLYAVKKFE